VKKETVFLSFHSVRARLPVLARNIICVKVVNTARCISPCIRAYYEHMDRRNEIQLWYSIALRLAVPLSHLFIRKGL
jgi:hypothetical protein